MKRLCFVALCLTAACGGDSDRTADFIGSWMYLAGSTSTLDCSENMLDMTSTLTGTFMIAAGTTSDIVEVPGADDTCPPIRYDVDGDKATAQTGQNCSETDDGITVMTTLNSYNGTLDSAGTRLTFTGQAAVTISGGFSTTCTASTTGSAMKVGAREGEVPTTSLGDAIMHIKL